MSGQGIHFNFSKNNNELKSFNRAQTDHTSHRTNLFIKDYLNDN